MRGTIRSLTIRKMKLTRESKGLGTSGFAPCPLDFVDARSVERAAACMHTTNCYMISILTCIRQSSGYFPQVYLTYGTYLLSVPHKITYLSYALHCPLCACLGFPEAEDTGRQNWQVCRPLLRCTGSQSALTSRFTCGPSTRLCIEGCPQHW